MEKKGSNTIPFLFVRKTYRRRRFKISTLYSIISTLLSLLYYLYSIFASQKDQPDKAPSPSPSAYPAPKPILACYERHVRQRRY